MQERLSLQQRFYPVVHWVRMQRPLSLSETQTLNPGRLNLNFNQANLMKSSLRTVNSFQKALHTFLPGKEDQKEIQSLFREPNTEFVSDGPAHIPLPELPELEEPVSLSLPEMPDLDDLLESDDTVPSLPNLDDLF